MDFDGRTWQTGPPESVLKDPAVEIFRTEECLRRVQALAFQLKLCFHIRNLLNIWDKEALPAWQKVAGEAGGILQRSVVKELILLTTHLLDDRKGSSSMTAFHKNYVKGKLVSGPFRDFYQPLCSEIIERGKELKGVRDEIIAHTNWQKLEARLYGPGEESWGDVNASRLFDSLTFLAWYVQLFHQVLGIKAGTFNREIAGAESLRRAVIMAYEDESSR